VPDSLLPWKPIAPSSCSRFSLWAIFGLGPLPPPFDAAASRPTIAPNPTTPDMIRSSGLPAACPAKLSRKLSPPRPTVVRHSRRSVNFIASSYSARNSLPSMRRSVRFVRPSRRRGLDSPGKKTAAAIHQELAREIATLPRPYLRRAAQSRPDRSRGHRDGTPGWLAPPGNGGFDRIAARRHSARRTAAAPLPLRPEGPLR
jgi:hypothetical protein